MSERDVGAQVPRWKSREPVCQRTLMRQYAPSRRKRRVDTRDQRETAGIAEGTSSSPCLANSSAALFPGRKECPGTHCSLIEQEEREDSSCQRD